MVEERNHKGGAPLGNQNARKHGFYSNVLDEDEKLDIEQAKGVDGIDDEIALLRVKIKSLAQHDPQNTRLMTYAINSLGRLVRTKYNLGKNDKAGLKEAIGNILKDFALPIGVGIGNIIKKG